MALRSPPFLKSVPLLGNAPAFFTDPVSLIRGGYEQYGRMFAMRLGRKPVVVMLGPEFNRFFFEQTDKLLSIREAYPFLQRMFDDQLFFMAPAEEYQAQRKILLPAFQGAAMNRYIAAMEAEAVDFMAQLGDQGEFDAVSALGPLVMNVAARAFLGDDFRRRLGGRFFDLFRDFSGAIDLVLPGWLPLPRFRRSAKARAYLHDMLGSLIAERRNGSGGAEDFLQVLVEARYPDGSAVPDSTIINLILLLVWAGHETTAGHISWGLIQLLQHPQYLATVRAEQEALLGAAGPLTMEKVRALKRIEWALKESERTRPVAYVLMRAARQPFELGGYQIPAGWLVATCAAVTHQLPDVFRNPERWDPERFSPARGEDKQGYSLIGFGGGAHRCLGVHFAYLEMKVVLTLLLQHYELELVDRDPQPVRGPVTKWPASPARIRYRRRGSSSLLRSLSTAENSSGSYAPRERAMKPTCPFHHTGADG